ncbi:DUF5643 domain-containing protein [Gorillibacterium massiliense]|uniref:DUF5643 domain-containing protein n=1 Tax=Gorillibacterium massiliense TaxID=1280390 RepID=UPI0004B8F004|nr:DUF5643 domain-containing protein [Gorillibacterium massiliense]
MSSQLDELLKQSAHRLNRHKLVLEVEPRTLAPVARRIRQRIVVTCMILFLSIAALMIPFSSKVLAYVANLIQIEGFQQVVDKGFVTPVGQKSLQHGIELSVENLYVDQGELLFDMVQSYGKEAVSRLVLNTNDVQLFIDGKKLANHTGGEFRDLQDGRYGGMIYYTRNYGYEEGPCRALPEQFRLTIQVNRIGDVQGNWSIEIPVSRELSDQATRTFEPRISHEVNGITINVERVLMTPLSTSIDFEMTVPENYSLTDPSAISSIQVKDDKGYIMGSGYITGEGEPVEGARMKYRFTSDNLHTPKETPKELVIIPQRSVMDKQDEWATYFHEEAFEPYVFYVPLQK